MIGGAAVPPGMEADDGVKALFHTEDVGEAERLQLEELIEAAMALPKRKRLRATLRLVGRQVAIIKQAAGPGPSGWRNSHISCLYSDPAGPRALLQWCSLWAQGDISPWLARLWSPALARPFWKNDLQDQRFLKEKYSMKTFLTLSLASSLGIGHDVAP